MADEITVETGTGTKERVAFDLMLYIHGSVDEQEQGAFRSKDSILAIYHQ